MLLIKMYIPPLKHCFIGETSVLTAYTKNVNYSKRNVGNFVIIRNKLYFY